MNGPGSPRVLVVEDRPGLGDAAARILSGAAVGLVSRSSGGVAAATDALDRGDADMLVLVCAEPQTTAAAVLGEIRRRGRDLPCVVVAGDSRPEVAVEIIRAGAVNYVQTERLARLPVVVERELRDAAERAARRRAELAASGLNDRLTGLLRAAHGMSVVIADHRGVITEWGEGAQRLLGHTEAEVVGTADLTIGRSPDELGALAVEVGAAGGLEALLATAGDADSPAREWELTRKDGGIVPVTSTIAAIRTAAGEITGYVELARDITTRRRHEDEQASLHRVVTTVAAEQEPAAIFALVAEEAATLLGAETAGVSRIDGDGAVEVGVWAAPGVTSLALGTVTPLAGESGIARAARSGTCVRIDDLSRDLDEPTRAAWGGRVQVRGAMACPVRVSGRIWGTLRVGSSRPSAFGIDDEVRLRRFGHLTALAIANAEARERIVSDAVAGVFRGDLDVSETIDMIVSSARRALGADRATCYVNADGSAVSSVHTTETDPARRAFLREALTSPRARMPVLQLLLKQVGRTLVVDDVSNDPSIPEVVAGALGAGAIVGMRLEHPSVMRGGAPELLGTLFMTYRRPRRFTDGERATAESLAGMAAVALANARLHDATVRTAAEAAARSTSDPLTGLANHRAFQERLSQEVTRAHRHRRSLSLALIDIDHFRRVNEQHGHQVGDQVLVEISRQLQAVARETDLVARVGGEEIAWLMPETEAMEAWQAVDRAREAIARTTLADVGRVTVSAGVCDLRQSGSSGELVRLSEGALYWAKQHGRDVAFLYSPEVVEELSAEERAERLQRLQRLQSIRVLARAVDAKDRTTQEHSERVADLAVAIGAGLGWDPERLMRLREAGLVHDVGKIAVPDRILFKPDRLTSPEYEEIKRHAEIGAEMVIDVLTAEQVAWVRNHHERWDGRGYPDGLEGDGIPEGARVLALADSWDVMTSDRPYHVPLTAAEAEIEIRRCAGAQFCPEVVEAMLRLASEGALPRAAAV